MVFFVVGGHYKRQSTSIIITGIGKDWITYKRERGTKEYRAKLHYARMKHSEHVLQYIHLDGTVIYSVNIAD